MGSISGSAIANVVTTGAFTIPLMKRLGYRPAQAGGIEAAASTGGQIIAAPDGRGRLPDVGIHAGALRRHRAGLDLSRRPLFRLGLPSWCISPPSNRA